MLNQLFKGWANLGKSAQRHYFVNGRSLCGRWRLFSDVETRDAGEWCKTCRVKAWKVVKAA
jgi:hypothetical protein